MSALNLLSKFYENIRKDNSQRISITIFLIALLFTFIILVFSEEGGLIVAPSWNTYLIESISWGFWSLFFSVGLEGLSLIYDHLVFKVFGIISWVLYIIGVGATLYSGFIIALLFNPLPMFFIKKIIIAS